MIPTLSFHTGIIRIAETWHKLAFWSCIPCSGAVAFIASRGEVAVDATAVMEAWRWAAEVGPCLAMCSVEGPEASACVGVDTVNARAIVKTRITLAFVYVYLTATK